VFLWGVYTPPLSALYFDLSLCRDNEVLIAMGYLYARSMMQVYGLTEKPEKKHQHKYQGKCQYQ